MAGYEEFDQIRRMIRWRGWGTLTKLASRILATTGLLKTVCLRKESLPVSHFTYTMKNMKVLKVIAIVPSFLPSLKKKKIYSFSKVSQGTLSNALSLSRFKQRPTCFTPYPDSQRPLYIVNTHLILPR